MVKSRRSHILSRIFAEAHFIGMAAIAVADVAAKGGDLDDIRLGLPGYAVWAESHQWWL